MREIALFFPFVYFAIGLPVCCRLVRKCFTWIDNLPIKFTIANALLKFVISVLLACLITVTIVLAFEYLSQQNIFTRWSVGLLTFATWGYSMLAV